MFLSCACVSFGVTCTSLPLQSFQLLRLAKASKVAARLSDHLAWSQQSINLISLFCAVLLLLHAFACTLGISTTFPESPADTWLTRLGYCAPVADAQSLLTDPAAFSIHPFLRSIIDEDSLTVIRPELLADAEGTTAVDGSGTKIEYLCMDPGRRYIACLFCTCEVALLEREEDGLRWALTWITDRHVR